MQKTMFNDRYELTRKVIDKIKTNTRRIEGGGQFQLAATSAEDFTYEEDTGYIVMCCQGIEIFRHKCRYKVGEVVAVAQSYEQAGIQSWAYLSRPEIDGYQIIYTSPGWRNKMFVRAELMPYQIRITGIRCEPLWAITDEDCMKEGVREHPYRGYVADGILYKNSKDKEYNGSLQVFNTPREAFAVLIDKVSGRGTWRRNPWVVVYEFELVK
ncbi:hypothetical protein [Alistipes sp.]|uniref:hypothetical protein n=1 Tax=Alistipes sp. TaxID=1872444 RepID=UPI003AB73E69